MIGISSMRTVGRDVIHHPVRPLVAIGVGLGAVGLLAACQTSSEGKATFDLAIKNSAPGLSDADRANLVTAVAHGLGGADFRNFSASDGTHLGQFLTAMVDATGGAMSMHQAEVIAAAASHDQQVYRFSTDDGTDVGRMFTGIMQSTSGDLTADQATQLIAATPHHIDLNRVSEPRGDRVGKDFELYHRDGQSDADSITHTIGDYDNIF